MQKPRVWMVRVGGSRGCLWPAACVLSGCVEAQGRTGWGRLAPRSCVEELVGHPGGDVLGYEEGSGVVGLQISFQTLCG